MRVIAGIIILLLSTWATLSVFKSTAYAAEGKSQVGTCRFSNAVKAGLEEKSGGWATGARLCSTIDKTEGDSQVPTKNYPQDSDGAAAEIREMIKNCWYMWLEGSVTNMFTKYPNTETCFVCYMFKIKDNIKDKDGKRVNFDEIEDTMDAPYLVGESEDWCAINGGFFESRDCGDGDYNLDDSTGWKETSSTKAASKGQKCCIRKDATNVCENKGGKCSSDGATSDYPKLYLKWHCPGGKKCYVNPATIDNMETYAGYITKNDGDIYFLSPDTEDARGYVSEQESAISFVSSSGKCDAVCQAGFVAESVFTKKIGTYFQFLGLQIIGFKHLAVKKYREIADVEEQPNFMIVSSLRDAQNLGCTIE